MVKDKAKIETHQNIGRFYQSPTGQVVRQLIMRRLLPLIPSAGVDFNTAGIGFTAPYLYEGDDKGQVLSTAIDLQTIEHEQAVEYGQCSRKTIVDAATLPLLDASLDFCLMVHGLETSRDAASVMDEAWRVLKGQGKFILIVSNRVSIWSVKDITPFGFGQPYSVNQIKKLLKSHGFATGKVHQALLAPPLRASLYAKLAPIIERLPYLFGGVLIVEAQKMIYSMRGVQVTSLKPTRAGGLRVGARTGVVQLNKRNTKT